MTIGRPQARISVLMTVPIHEEAEFRTSGPQGKMCAAEWHGSACNGLNSVAAAWIRHIEKRALFRVMCSIGMRIRYLRACNRSELLVSSYCPRFIRERRKGLM
jgi:hypothetical protein